MSAYRVVEPSGGRSKDGRPARTNLFRIARERRGSEGLRCSFVIPEGSLSLGIPRMLQ